MTLYVLDSAAVRTRLRWDAGIHGHQASYTYNEENPKEQSIDGFSQSLPFLLLHISQRSPALIWWRVGAAWPRLLDRRGAGAPASRPGWRRFQAPDRTPSVGVWWRRGGRVSQEDASDEVRDCLCWVFTEVDVCNDDSHDQRYRHHQHRQTEQQTYAHQLG